MEVTADDVETLYRECLLAYTVTVMGELGGQFVPARDLRAIFLMGYQAGLKEKHRPKAPRRRPNFAGIPD